MHRPTENAFLNFTVVRYATPDGDTLPNKSPFPTTQPYKSLEHTISCPDGALDGAIHFSIIPGNEHHEQAYMKINKTDASQAIVNFFNDIEPNSNAFPSFTIPPTAIDHHSVDTRPPINNSFPTNCQFIGC
jgi:hypothetical protein